MTESLSLTESRLIRATPERLFEAWTRPEQLLLWWGPATVKCVEAEVDLRPGGRYRLGNQLPDGSIVLIQGEFLRVERPTELEYTWRVKQGAMRPSDERVRVRFEAQGEHTRVEVFHDRIGDTDTRRGHAHGWHGCLEGLAQLLEEAEK